MPVPTPPPTLPLHRIRFFDHTPTPITALAFAPLPLPPARDPASNGAKGKAREEGVAPLGQGERQAEFGVLVVAREGGEVEVWGYVPPENRGMGNWVLDKVLPPTLTHPNISLMALVIRDPANFHLKPYLVPKLSDLRLFTAGSDSSDLTERCLHSGRILHAHPFPSAPLWSLTASPTQTLLCLATTSPTLHFLSIPPSGPIEPPPPHLLRSETLPSRTRTVSVAWGVPKLAQTEGEWEWRDTYLVTGNSDSSFRKWEISPPDPTRMGAGKVILKSRAVVEKLGKRGGKKASSQKGTIVWGVGVLPDHTIVTSDSLGSVTFWDGATLAQKQQFQAHKADGMCLTLGQGGRTVYTSGPDQKVCQFTLVAPTSTSFSGSQWALTTTKRMHFHDVRALAIFPPFVPTPTNMPAQQVNPNHAPVLASGGWDMSLVLTPAATPDLSADKLRNPLGKSKGLSRVVFEESYPRKMSYLGGGRGTGRIAIAKGPRLVVGRKDRSVGIWRVLEDEQGWVKALEMELRLRTNIISTAISEDGHWLAISDLYETKLFNLTASPTGTLRATRLRTLLDTLHSSLLVAHLDLPSNGCGATSLLFTPDGSRLVLGLAASAQVVVLDLPRIGEGEGEGLRVSKCFLRDERTVGGRVIKSIAGKAGTEKEVVSTTNGSGKTTRQDQQLNGYAETSEDDEDNEDEDEQRAIGRLSPGKGPVAWISSMAASDDGQWLAVSDLEGKVSVFNLDTLQPHAILPTFPHSPVTLLFPPCHPNHHTHHQPYHAHTKKHHQPPPQPPPNNQQIAHNQTLRDQYLPFQSAAFEPSRRDPRNAKLIIWSHEWIATARLDLDAIARVKKGVQGYAGSMNGNGNADSPSSPSDVSKSLRRKRAREAREQLEAVSGGTPSVDLSYTHSDIGTPTSRTSGAFPGLMGEKGASSADDPEFVKVTANKFRSIAYAGWVGEGEVGVVERPLGDFEGELPPAFWTGRFGKS